MMTSEKELNGLGVCGGMVEILCPHCDEEIALDDDASGEFSCPHCDGDFEWNTEPESFSSHHQQKEAASIVDHPIQWIGHGFTIFMMIFLLMFFFSSEYYSVSLGDEQGPSFSRTEVTDELGSNEYSSSISQYEKEYVQCMTSDEMEGFEDLCLILEEWVEYYYGWQAASLSITITYMLAMICSVIAISARVVMMLERTQVLNVPLQGLRFSYFATRYIPFVISGLMVLGTLLFMIIAPKGDDIPLIGDLVEINGSFAFIIWSSLLMALIYIGVNVFDMQVS